MFLYCGDRGKREKKQIDYYVSIRLFTYWFIAFLLLQSQHENHQSEYTSKLLSHHRVLMPLSKGGNTLSNSGLVMKMQPGREVPVSTRPPEATAG